jgi:hypothetical protein
LLVITAEVRHQRCQVRSHSFSVAQEGDPGRKRTARVKY